MMHLWTIKEIVQESSDVPAIQDKIQETCRKKLFQLVELGVIDTDVAALSAEVSEDQLKKLMNEEGYEYPDPPAPIIKGDSYVDEVVTLKEKEKGVGRLMNYLLVVYMLDGTCKRKRLRKI